MMTSREVFCEIMSENQSDAPSVKTVKKVAVKAVKPVAVELARAYHLDEPRLEIGLDEAGRGPLFGRLFVGGVVLPFRGGEGAVDDFHYDWMKDSKKFYSHQKRLDVAAYIRENALAYHVAYVEASEIDEINILNAVYKGMHECVREIAGQLRAKGLEDGEGGLWKEKEGMFLLVDGNLFEPVMEWNGATERYDIPDFITVEGGDNKYCSIAAASILAKVAHDEYILDMCSKYPELETRYGLLKGMGYATKAHLEGIQKHGISQWHRRTFGVNCRNAALCPVALGGGYKG
jgi:ribonuclease HII